MTPNITESFTNYGGFIIRLRAGICLGLSYDIIKETSHSLSPNGIKKIYLRKKTWNFIEPEAALLKAKNYIDEFESVLINKFNKIIEQL